MTTLRGAVASTVGTKLLTGVTGLSLCLFVTLHLAGNLLLLADPNTFNRYAHSLATAGHGAVMSLGEAGLVVLFVAHALSGVRVWIGKRSARPSRYRVVGKAGGPSRKSLSSRSMIVTGAVLSVFVVLHVWMFRLGPGTGDGYTTIIDGAPARDLYRLVIESFQDPLVVAGYTAAMVVLGVHLRHGFWSAFQSLGLLDRRLAPVATTLGWVFAAVMAIGFLLLPIWIFVALEAPGAVAAVSGGAP